MKNEKDFYLTQKELEGLSKAIKNPEFHKLFNEYLEEVSDPKGRAEQEEYLRQLEKAGEIPEGKQLIRPKSHFCIKSIVKKQKQTQKCFVNICSAECIAQPQVYDQEKGKNWSVPYSLSKYRADRDAKDIMCLTYDCIFHPYAIQISTTSLKFKQLLCDIAIDAAAKDLKEKAQVNLSKDYKVLTKKSCKGGNPDTIMIDVQGIKSKAEATPEQSKISLNEQGPQIYKEMMSQKSEFAHKKKEEEIKEEMNETIQFRKEREEQEISELLNKKEASYKITYSYGVDYANFIEDTRIQPVNQIPQELVVQIVAPLISSAAEIQLDASEDQIKFIAPGKHELLIKLPYKVDNEGQKASFDKKRRTLTLRLPVQMKLYLKMPKIEVLEEKEFDENDLFFEEQEKIRIKEKMRLQRQQELEEQKQQEMESENKLEYKGDSDDEKDKEKTPKIEIIKEEQNQQTETKTEVQQQNSEEINQQSEQNSAQQQNNNEEMQKSEEKTSVESEEEKEDENKIKAISYVEFFNDLIF